MYKLHLYIYKIMDNNKCIDLKRDVSKIKIKVTFPTVLPLFSDANIFFSIFTLLLDHKNSLLRHDF